MYNFYQSLLWRHINSEIYHKPTGIITINQQEYQYIIKRRTILGVTINWYQILGIELPMSQITDPEQFREAIVNTCRTHFTGQGDCFVQLGIINQLGISPIEDTKSQGYRAERDSYRRQQSSAMMCLGGYEGLVENMPAATIIIDLGKEEDQLWSDLSRSTRTHVSKAYKGGLTVQVGDLVDRDVFYEMWIDTGNSKGFSIQSRDCYDALRDYLIDTNQGCLHIVRDNGVIVAGAICVMIGDVYVYLYGATYRGGANMGHAQLLHWEIIKHAKQQGFSGYDLLGCAPGSMQPHHLDGVTQFKSGFGGQKIEYIGNYDFPLSMWKYEVFKWYRKAKK